VCTERLVESAGLKSLLNSFNSIWLCSLRLVNTIAQDKMSKLICRNFINFEVDEALLLNIGDLPYDKGVPSLIVNPCLSSEAS
jgi:hypothetical protein